MGHPPDACTFHRLLRPVRFVVKTISLPSGDHDGPPTLRVKKSSSMGMGLAAGLEGDVTDAGSVTWRSSGPDDIASITMANDITGAQRILTSTSNSQQYIADLQVDYNRCDCAPSREVSRRAIA